MIARDPGGGAVGRVAHGPSSRPHWPDGSRWQAPRLVPVAPGHLSTIARRPASSARDDTNAELARLDEPHLGSAGCARPTSPNRNRRDGGSSVGAVLRANLSAAALVVLYYLLPLDQPLNGNTVTRLIIGLLVFAGIAVWQIRTIVGSRYPAIRAFEALGLIVPFYLVVFASTYFLMEHASAGNFSQPLTRTDALYFTVTVFATVGFGDITAKSQPARVVRHGPDARQPRPARRRRTNTPRRREPRPATKTRSGRRRRPRRPLTVRTNRKFVDIAAEVARTVDATRPSPAPATSASDLAPTATAHGGLRANLDRQAPAIPWAPATCLRGGADPAAATRLLPLRPAPAPRSHPSGMVPPTRAPPTLRSPAHATQPTHLGRHGCACSLSGVPERIWAESRPKWATMAAVS